MAMFSTTLETAKSYPVLSKALSPTLDESPARAGRTSPYRRAGKRAFETVFILGTAPITLVVLAVMLLLVALDGHNPFYSQIRVGRDGRHFRMWKLRTMVPDADAQLASYLAANSEAKAEWDANQKLKRDPRITFAGRILRKTSLDELPQLWNVLNGTMALVGPRPMMLSQQDEYRGQAYYRLRPGITGLWQVSERNEGEFVGRVRFDDVYERTVSFRMDVWIILRSVSVVLRATGY